MLTKGRGVFLVLLGVAGLVLKGYYSGLFAETVACYGGNVTASFAVYFLARSALRNVRFGTLLGAALGLAAVESFEATNGFGIMTNVYDPVDFAANVIGIGLALAVDAAASAISGRSTGRASRRPIGERRA